MSHNPYWNAKNGARPWTAEEDRELLAFVGTGQRYHILARRLKRTETAISMRLLVVDPDKKARPARAVWTADHVELAKKLLKERASNEIFVRLLGHTIHQARQKLVRLAYHERRLANDPVKPAIIVPPEVIEDRNRRLMADRDLTAALMGDPPRGYSALERRI